MYKILLKALFFCVLVSISVKSAQAQAVESAQDSLRKAYTQATSDSLRITTLLALAKSYRGLSPDSTLAISKRALQLAKYSKLPGLEASAHRSVGAGYFFKGEYTEAAAQEKQALIYYMQAGDTVQVAMSENNIGTNYLNQGLYDSALIHLANARRQFRVLEDTAKELFVANNIGIIHIRKANYPEAMRTFLEGLEVAELYNDERTRLLILNNIGVIHEKQNNWSDALAINLQLLEAYQSNGNKVQEALTLNNLGVVYNKLGRQQEAHESLNKAIALYGSLNNQDGVARAKSNLGNQFVYQNKATAGEVLLCDAHQYFAEVDNKSGLLKAATGLAQANLALNKVSKAEEYALQALTLYKEIEETKVGPDLYETLHKVYEAKGNYREAYRYHKQFKTLNDSLFNLDRETEINRLAYLHQLQQNAGLQKEDSLKQKQLATQQAYNQRSQLLLAWITVAALLLAGLVLVYYIKGKKLRLAYRQLRDQNLEIIKNREDIRLQAIQLQEANEEIQQINENLEALVQNRTLELENKNKQLEEYAFLNAHKLRAPVARLLGLIHVAKLAQNQEELRDLMVLSQREANEVDRIVRRISKAIQDGVPLDRWGIEE